MISENNRIPDPFEAITEEPTGTSSPEYAESASVRMKVSVLPVINFAMHQNGAVAIQCITLENLTDTTVENAELKITSAPEFAMPFVHHVDCLPPKQVMTISRPKLILNAEYLAGLTEKITGALLFSLCCDDRVLASETVETTVLAFDEWHGLSIYPELLAMFVTPNHPDIAGIITRATEILGEMTGDTSMDGYQSQDQNRVLNQAAAIYLAIKEREIAYVVPPASFESMGQRVRLCDMVLQQKLGTCLDLTLLYASCLEAVGLHPLLLTVVGHIFTGIWLEDRMFPDCVQDDVSLITKRIATGVNEIAVVETTCVTNGADRSFADARAIAERELEPQTFEYIIDVHRARMSHIVPIPQRVRTASGWAFQPDKAFVREQKTLPHLCAQHEDASDAAQKEPVSKQAQWERKLLDLGMRNTLINLRLTKTLLPILAGIPDELENALADGGDFTIMPRPGDLHMEKISFEALQEAETEGLVLAELKNKRLRSVLTGAELTKRLKDLYRASKTALEENGANTLYLALGLLRWYETAGSAKPRYAPLILLPIEMIRKSAAQGYVIRLRDDEPRMNITLLEKLKQDFGIVVNGLEPLPGDEHGVDIRGVFTIMRKAIMEQPRWDVLETASIGIFSFSQFMMWNDIRNRAEDLMRNKVVRSLIDGKLSWEAKPLEIDAKVEENDVLLPMPADASQLFVIRAACEGESLVVHGPPGTGKSQTITSLIANALAQGKTVLFVAEKRAALEVVQKRLEQIGIGAFCLELHSNKSRKRDVLEQLRKAAEVTKTQTADEFSVMAEQIAAMRAELDVYAEQLHKTLPCGQSLFALINDYELYKNVPDIRPFTMEYIRSLDHAAIEQHKLVLEQLLAAAREIGHPHNHPLTQVGCIRYTQNLRNRLQTTVTDYSALLQRVSDYIAPLLEPLRESQPDCFEDIQRIGSLASHSACLYDMPCAWTQTESPQALFEDMGSMAGHYRKAAALEQQLLQTFTPAFLSQNGEQLFTEYAQASSQWLIPRMVGLSKLTRRIDAFAKTLIDSDSLPVHLTALRDYQKEKQLADALFKQYGGVVEPLIAEDTPDWEKIEALASAAKNSTDMLYEHYGSYDFMRQSCDAPALREAVCGLRDCFAEFEEAAAAFNTLLQIVPEETENWPESQAALCRTILAHTDALKEWIAYRSIAAEAESLGLDNVVETLTGGIEPEKVLPVYQKALLKGLIADAIGDAEILEQFSGAVFRRKIEQYKRMDSQWTTLSRQELYCRLASRVPDFTAEAAHSSELGILQRCIRSGGRGVGIRRLFEQIPNLLPRLCPCMLMSPISAAQYLDPAREPFDIVVFDEASQLPTCKAVGALARGKNAVIVGDPKQMPPTSFFVSDAVDEDNLEAEDLESILDDCLALSMPQAHLLWHYRSRHESLIAFSNSQFYENRLLTFPSVNDRESKVRLVHVDGVFERGKSRKNRAEAEAVIAELIRRCHDPELAKYSVGIVTFNIAQQNLIDDLLSAACVKDPALEQWAFGDEEPVFIKNLENVQGDERDVILFSVGYGPDENGRLYMNFGPLNRDGGWRRLNVAVSRARCEMIVFSALHADQIDMNKTNAEGVSALRSFLEYADGRTRILSECAVQKRHYTKEGIAAAICEALHEKGYETDRAVGRSEYRIDIGVVDPESPDSYMLGIMLDGADYGAAKTTRDREVAQISVLNGLGWNIMRIWSMDWWDNGNKELNRIFAKLDELRNGVSASADVAAETTPSEEAAAIAVKPVSTKLSGNRAMRAIPKLKTAPAVPVVTQYIPAALPNDVISAEAFVSEQNTHEICSRIQAVIEAEAPISAALLTKRVIQSYGITRAGSRIQNHMNALLRKMHLHTTTEGNAVWYWRADQSPERYCCVRANGAGEQRRDVRDVPVQEAANAVCMVLYEQFSMQQEDLLRETAGKLGCTRLGGNVQVVLMNSIRYAETKGFVTVGSNGAYGLSRSGMARMEAGYAQ